MTSIADAPASALTGISAGRRWFTLMLQVVIASVMAMLNILNVLIGPLAEANGWGITEVLFTFTLAFWIGSPATIVGGRIRDAFGNRPVILVGAILYGVGVVASGLVTNVIAFILLQGIVVTAITFSVTVAQLHNVGALFPDRRGFVIGLFLGLGSLGTALLTPFAAWLTEQVTPGMSMVLQGIIYGGVAAVLATLIASAPKNTPDVPVESDLAEGRLVGSLGLEVPWRRLVRLPSLYLLLVTFFLATLTPGLLITNVSLMAQAATGIDAISASWMSSAFLIATGIGGLVMGYLSDKVGEFRMLGIMAALVGLSLVIVVLFLSSIPVFVGMVVISGLAFGCYTTLLPAIVMNVYGQRHFGVNYGILGLQVLVQSLLLPWLGAAIPIQTAFIICATASFLGIGAVLLAQRSIQKLLESRQRPVLGPEV